MDHIYLGVKLPEPRNYERVRVDVSFNENVSQIIEKFREIVQIKDEKFSLLYRGNILEEFDPIKKYNLRSGSTVHVLRKNVDDLKCEGTDKFTEMEVQQVTANFRSLNSGNFHKISRPEVAKAIYDAHPELKKDCIALSFLRDPILLSNLQNPDTVRKMAQHHRLLIDASDTIVKALKSAKNLIEPTQAPAATAAQSNIDDLSDSSSSSSDNSPRASNSNMMRRITREYLTQALQQAQGRNSLANISQRNLSQADSNPISPSPSSSSVPSAHQLITPSMFMNAMNEVLLAHRRSANAPSEQSTQAEPSAPNQEINMEEDEVIPEDSAPSVINQEINMEEDEDARMIASFATQLGQMKEMGLNNTAANIQALMVCNGNLEAAVNFVLAEMHNMT